MGNKPSVVNNSCVEELTNINENDLDISNIDKFQIKALKEMNNKIKELPNKQSDRIMYKLPAIQLCSWRLT